MGYYEDLKNVAVKKFEQVKNAAAKKIEAAKQAGMDWAAKKQSDEFKADQASMTNEEKQHSYDTARESMLGEFAGTYNSLAPKCIAVAKAVRRQERLELVNKGLVSCPGRAEEAARLRRDMDEVENMRCAKQVYLANDINAPSDLRDNPPIGFTKATDAQLEEMGLEQDMLTPEGTEFKAAVYMKDPAVWGDNPKPPAVLAFRGSTPAKEDWDNNFAQGVNREAPYFKRAVEIGNALADNNADVQIVGHSLGGGLASAAQGGSGLIASTYNSSGLHPETVARYSTDRAHMQAEAQKITAYRIKGEVLTKTQESGLTSKVMYPAVGMKKDLEPAHSWDYFERFDRTYRQKQVPYDGINVEAESEVKKIADQKSPKIEKEQYEKYLHGMEQVIFATEKQKTADEQALKNCLGRQGG